MCVYLFFVDDVYSLKSLLNLRRSVNHRCSEVVTPTPISVIIAQRSLMAGQTLCRALKVQRKNFTVVGCVQKPEDLLKQAAELHPDVAVISAFLDGDPDGGLKALRKLRVSATTTRAIVLLECSDAKQAFDAFSEGAKGVVCRSDAFEALCKGIQCVHAGQIWADTSQLQWIFETLRDREPPRIVGAKGIPLLTKREEQIAQMVAEGMPNQAISSNLGISLHTVKNHLFRIDAKLGISNRVELVLYALSSRDRS
jgi:DNA-binding NarL/FixJ family response regulator